MDDSLRRNSKRVKHTEAPQGSQFSQHSTGYVSGQSQAVLTTIAISPYDATSIECDQPVDQQARMQLPQHGSMGGVAHYLDTEAGFIHHSAVLTEHESSIGIPSLGHDPTCRSQVSQSYIDQGVVVLTVLKDFPRIQNCIDK